MTKPKLTSELCKVLSTAVAFLLLASCSSSGSLLPSKLDPLTAVTITYSKAPLVFYRNESGRAAHARDYVHLGPLEVNRSGTYSYYLWLGIWNTMQDARGDEPRDGFDAIVVFADGEPLPLEIAGWTPAAIGASEHAYMKPVASAADAYYAVTVDQLRMIAEATDLRVQSTGPQGKSYEPWDSQASAKASLTAFLSASVY
ncbi:MAG: hypothetical protein OER22_03855 [Gammaproteobacteria bacterium]|nr:hypothetical protein [Gammaproteobacteria bacterium]MDH3372909.1 hypothetical protein [Gammaproteobacteria bacterium]MDH3408264.1 hypothetical protein [Gammaproteobacteria bacterium]MDH3551730.1 hypothetical protein [Gammaproteobacteria bacterium]